jgi:molecular chaperone DnaJ
VLCILFTRRFGGGQGGFHQSHNFRNAEDLFSSIFGNFGGGGRQRDRDVQVQCKSVADSQLHLELSFEESIAGVKRVFDIPTRVKCQPCGLNSFFS